MGSAIPFTVAYRCPRCAARLEAPASLADGWFRCPSCGFASLPPESIRKRPTGPGALSTDDVLLTAPGRRQASGIGQVGRIAGASALFLSLLIAVFAALEKRYLLVIVVVVVALACLAVALYPWRRH